MSKTMMAMLFSIALGASFPAKGDAVFQDGKLMFQQCHDRSEARVGFCFGYIMGIAEMVANKRACFVAGTTFEQILFHVRNWMAKRPQLHKHSANSLVIASLEEGFPCPKKPKIGV